MRIGIFSGVFDPVHTGHIRAAIETKESLYLDLVVFVPSGNPPHKSFSKIVASAKDRFNMLKIATREWNWMKVSDYEIKKKGICYTVDTVKEIVSIFGRSNKYFLLTGSDWKDKIDKWKNFSYIKKICRIVFLNRKKIKRYDSSYIKMPYLEISSTLIRKKISEKKDISLLVPLTVLRYIKSHRLYIK